MEAALSASLPDDAFRQNSKEEFRYLQEQRKQADRDRRAKEMFDKEQANRKTESENVVKAIQNLDLTNTGTTPI